MEKLLRKHFESINSIIIDKLLFFSHTYLFITQMSRKYSLLLELAIYLHASVYHLELDIGLADVFLLINADYFCANQ